MQMNGSSWFVYPEGHQAGTTACRQSSITHSSAVVVILTAVRVSGSHGHRGDLAPRKSRDAGRQSSHHVGTRAKWA